MRQSAAEACEELLLNAAECVRVRQSAAEHAKSCCRARGTASNAHDQKSEASLEEAAAGR